MISLLTPLHLSTGDMDGHTQLIFEALCLLPFLVLVAVVYREHRRASRHEPPEGSPPEDSPQP